MVTGKTGGSWQLGGLLQFWGVLRDAGTTTASFRIRRADFRLKGEIIPKLATFSVSIDPAKVFGLQTTSVLAGTVDAPTNTTVVSGVDVDHSVLQDFYLTLQSDYVDFVVGQFKIPISLEANWSSGKLLFPERSLVSSLSGSAGVDVTANGATTRYRGYADNRELGFKLEKKLADVFYYSVGLYNGAGQNVVADNDPAKDLGVRVEGYPIKGLTVGGALYSTIGRNKRIASTDTVGVDLRYEDYNFVAHHEYIHSWRRAARAASNGAVEGHGYAGALGYTFAKHFQPVVRIGFLTPNLNTKKNTVLQYEAVFNYLLQGHDYKVQLAAGAFDPRTDGAPTLWQGILAVQGSF